MPEQVKEERRVGKGNSKSKPRQQRLPEIPAPETPGLTPVQRRNLINAAQQYEEARDERMQQLTVEIEAKANLGALMKQLGLQKFEYEDQDGEAKEIVFATVSSVKVRKAKREEEEVDDENT